VPAVELPRQVGRRVRFADWLISGKLVSTKTGGHMEFLTFEDETGLVETTFFPQAYRRFCHLLECEPLLMLSGRVEED
jgi:error-prone DNA polymerase